MNTVPFGRTGEHVSEMCLGSMMFGDRCDEAGPIAFCPPQWSKAPVSSTRPPCTALASPRRSSAAGSGSPPPGRVPGDKVHKGIDAPSILSSIDESLARLQTDYVDLYLIHWPVEGMRPGEIMEALARVVEQGKARFVGCCNYPAWLLAHSNAIASENGWPRLVCNQIPTT